MARFWTKFKRFAGRHPFLTIVSLGLIAIVLGASIGLIAQPLSTGFLSWNVDTLNTYNTGSRELSPSGAFNFYDANTHWTGRVQLGNVYFLNDTDLGWAQIGYESVQTHIYWFQADLLAYTLNTYTDMIPGIGYGTSDLVTQYIYSRWPGHNTYYWQANRLFLPSNYVTTINQVLNLNVGIKLQLDPSLLNGLFPQEFNNTNVDGTYHFNGAWAGILRGNADPSKEFLHGLLSQPGTTIITENFTNPNQGATGIDYKGTTASASESRSDIQTAIDNVKLANRGHHFDIALSSPAVMVSASDWAAGMGLGDPITMTINEASETGEDYSPGMLNNNTRQKAIAWMPVTLRPKTTIYQTTYSYNEIHVDDWFGIQVCSAYNPMTKTYPSGVDVDNSFVIQPVRFGIAVASNYTYIPIQASYNEGSPLWAPPTQPPNIYGTGDIFNAGVTSAIRAADGEGFGLLDWFFDNWIWILVVGLAIVAVIIVVKVRGNTTTIKLSRR